MAIFPKCPRHPEREEVTSPSWWCSDQIHFGVGQTWSSLSPVSAGRPPPSLPSEKHPPPLIAIETEWGSAFSCTASLSSLATGKSGDEQAHWNDLVVESIGKLMISPGKFPATRRGADIGVAWEIS
ncbi:hypothetical protein PVAP13_3NG181093 [Panicum virgatum]|uniref:Uncharacterized protein n=1 Tax=Panicum virgatum TaxID=38727 RepID=A0A8T0U5Z7_PANVG|nr:hypothetical protein PVAP13_3NG181093 [Panicum virgatum]